MRMSRTSPTRKMTIMLLPPGPLSIGGANSALDTEFSYLLGPTYPCPITVRMEPFFTSAFEFLI